MKCPKCGYVIPAKKMAAEIGRKGGKVSSKAKIDAALAREARKREENKNGR